MNAYPTLVSWAVYLWLNLTLLGASLALGVAIAFKFIPTSLSRMRYFITLAAFCAASLLPILATMGVNFRQPASLRPPEVSSRNALSDNTRDLVPAIEPAPPVSADFRQWVPGFARRLNEHPLAAALLWLWLSGSALLLGRELIGHISLWRARRKWKLAAATLRQALSWPNHIPLYLHPHSGPSTVGWLRPAVVLPQRLLNDLPSTAIIQVAQHELAHARWRDPLVNALLRLLRALLWPSLPLWFLERLTYTEREAAADQAAITDRHAHPESNRLALDYAASLLSIAEWGQAAAARSFNPLGTQAGGRKALENRVYRLLKASPRLNLARAVLGLAALLGGLMTMNWLPMAVAERHSASSGLDRADAPPAAGANQTAEKSQAVAKPTTKRENYPTTLNQGSVASRATIQQTAPEENEKAPASRTEGETKSPAQSTPPYPPNRIIFNKYGAGSAVLVRQTVEGEIEEPLLPRSEAQMKAAATKQVMPSYPEDAALESRFSWVRVSVLVDEDGHVISTRARAGNRNPIIEQRAVEAARQWEFTPATIDGKPIKVYGDLTLSGSLDSSKGWVEIR